MSGIQAVALNLFSAECTETDAAVVVTRNTTARGLLRSLAGRIGSDAKL
jgi:hypothetical protein